MQEQLILQKLRGFREDSMWINEHYDELKVKYPDEFVAVFKREVVGHNQDIKELMAILRAEYPQNGGDIAVEFVSPKKIELIL